MQFDPGHEYCKAERRAVSHLSDSLTEGNSQNLTSSSIKTPINQPPS